MMEDMKTTIEKKLEDMEKEEKKEGKGLGGEKGKEEKEAMEIKDDPTWKEITKDLLARDVREMLADKSYRFTFLCLQSRNSKWDPNMQNEIRKLMDKINLSI